MKYVLDTFVVSDMVNGHQATLAKVKKISPEYICISTLTKMEIVYGIKKNPEKGQRIIGAINDFLDCATLLDFNGLVATKAGEVRALLQEKGTPIGAYDLLIGATALLYQYTLVTANTRAFERIPGLTVENWRD